jgi:hypothetical protein
VALQRMGLSRPQGVARSGAFRRNSPAKASTP